MTTSLRTLRTLGNMMGQGLLSKLLKRARRPSLMLADTRRLATELRRDGIRLYAEYHRARQTPGRVYRIRRRDCRMWLPISWGETVAQRRFGLFEPQTFDTLQRITRPGFIVIELGACYGEFSIHLSRLVGGEGRVYSFEPFPKYYAIAERNIAINGLVNVRLLMQAVGSATTTELRLDPEANNPYASLSQISGLDYGVRVPPLQDSDRLTVSVPSVSLPAFMSGEGVTPDLIFMDIEGCELQVIMEIEPLLRSTGKRPIVYFELHPEFYKKGDQEALETLFRDCGYVTERIAGHLLCTPRDPAGLERRL